MITALLANTTSIYLSWEEPADNNAPILMYQITLQVVGSGIGGVSVFTSNTTELTVTGLTPFTNYSVQVVAENSIGTSAPSVLRTVMTAEGSECVCVCLYTPVQLNTCYMLLCAWNFNLVYTMYISIWSPCASHMSVTCNQYCVGRTLLSFMVWCLVYN